MHKSMCDRLPKEFLHPDVIVEASSGS